MTLSLEVIYDRVRRSIPGLPMPASGTAPARYPRTGVEFRPGMPEKRYHAPESSVNRALNRGTAIA